MILPNKIAEKIGPRMKKTKGFQEYTSENPTSFEYMYMLEANQNKTDIIRAFFLTLKSWISCCAL